MELLLGPLVSGISGALLNWVPEIFKFFQQRQANAHELAMLDKQREIAKEAHGFKMAEVQEVNASADFQAAHKPQISMGVQAIDAAKGWGVSAPWIMPVVYMFALLDWIIGSVRPNVTYMVVGSYFYYRYNVVLWLQKINTTSFGDALRVAWTPMDTDVVFLILGFWFGARIKTRDSGAR